ncbi:sugar kinase [Agriterribacter sp.]|uniref:sugar kinase n=1 Tax=Agriterribacter sp. TaxID=2821509 RepID=UPI002B9EF824|nr:sugar kinase [Agriterribacter sp.]HTN05332.1 sugar kinase [Agriterribacter sp.]
MNKKIALFGEYLLRLTPPQQQKLVQTHALEMHWAGSEANIAVSLAIFGSPSLYITALPDNELARAGLSQLYKYGVQTHIISTADTRVGTYYYESGQGARPGRVIYDREHSAFSYLKPNQVNWSEIFETADWFHWSGITPALNQQLADTCREALQAAQQSNLVISADFNYRNTLWKYGKHCSQVMPELLQYCDVILADVDTAKLYFGIEPDADHLVESTFTLLKKTLPNVKHMAMTMRKQESASSNQYTGYLWHEGEIYASQPYHMQHIAERIGAGDAFMAGLIHSLKTKKSLNEVIEFATACGVIKHTITGDFNVATRQEIDTVIQQSGSGRIIR